MIAIDCPDCTAYGRHTSIPYIAHERWWGPCEMHGMVSEQRAAVLRLGPFATRPKPQTAPEPLPGYVWNGECYVRIADPDFKQVWADGLRAVAALRRRGEW